MIKHVGKMTVAGHRGDMYNCYENTMESFNVALTQKGIEPWIGAGVTQKSLLKMASEYGARLVTCNNTADILEKLKELGLR